MKYFLLLIVLAIFTLPAAAQTIGSVASLGPEGEKAYQTLLTATQFTIGPAGFAGAPSNEETALHALLHEATAEQACANLVTDANFEGGLYGLLGLRLLNSHAFPEQLKKYRLREPPRARIVGGIKVADGQIVSMSGCFILRVAWEETLSQLEAGAFDKQFQLGGNRTR